jgi:hypothetical protein
LSFSFEDVDAWALVVVVKFDIAFVVVAAGVVAMAVVFRNYFPPSIVVVA